MKILICTNHFYPETFKVNDIAWHLQEQGHEVTVLTAIPDYPRGHYFEGYGIFRKRVETVRGVKVYRAFIIPRGKGGTLRLALNYVSYALSSVLLVLYLCLTRRFDAVFVHETSPVMIGIPGVLAKKLQRIPLCFWVLDLWPESLSAAGGIRNKHVLGFFNRMTKWIYRHSDKILMSSNGFRESILKKGDFADKLEFFPNWGENLFLDETNRRQALPTLPDGFRIMFAGNMGEAQNFENVMEVARRLKDTNIRWILIGDGRKRRWIESYIADNQLQDNVFLYGNHPITEMPSWYAQADMLFLSLKSNEIFDLTVPAKLQAYMASAKPVLAMINGETARVIHDAKAGFATGADDIDGMCSLIKEHILPNRTSLTSLGTNALNYYMQHYHHDICMQHLDRIFRSSNR